MLKLSQINITEPNTLIAEILEPVVYTHVGTIAKTDENISKEKDRVYYLLAKVVKSLGEYWVKNQKNEDIIVSYEESDIIMIPRSTLQPITFPIEGYDSPKLSVINVYSIFAKITDEAVADYVVESK